MKIGSRERHVKKGRHVRSKDTKASQVKPTFFPTLEFTSLKKIQFSITEINIEIKATATAVNKNELKYFLISEGNTCIKELNLEVLPLI